MRVAPIGLVARNPFDLAVEVAALTHGHPSGFLSAGALAEIIGGLMNGDSLRSAIETAMAVLGHWPDHDETLRALKRAIDLAGSAPVTPETVERLGAGWVAEEALAIAAYCALVSSDLRSGLLLAVNHSGDSDSTGSIAGNILGAYLGVEMIPNDFLDDLEGRDLITTVAEDLVDALIDGKHCDPSRYPTW